MDAVPRAVVAIILLCCGLAVTAMSGDPAFAAALAALMLARWGWQ
jgi:hypothetical protein